MPGIYSLLADADNFRSTCLLAVPGYEVHRNCHYYDYEDYAYDGVADRNKESAHGDEEYYYSYAHKYRGDALVVEKLAYRASGHCYEQDYDQEPGYYNRGVAEEIHEEARQPGPPEAHYEEGKHQRNHADYLGVLEEFRLCKQSVSHGKHEYPWKQ